MNRPNEAMQGPPEGAKADDIQGLLATELEENHESDSKKELAPIREALREGFGGEDPDVFFALGSSIKQITGKDGYRTFGYAELSEHGLVTGSRTRVIAATKIAEAMPDLPLVTTSFNRFDPDEPTMAGVVREELVRRGVSPDRIELEESSFSTVTQLTEMIKMAVNNGWQKVAALTNEFHLPRISEMYNQLETIIDDDEFQGILQEFKARGGKVSFICAETIMRMISSHYVTYLDAVSKTEAFAATQNMEARGLADLKAGGYRVVLNPEKPRD